VVDKVASYKIYVIGEVKNSGQYQVGQYLDVVQALALAGGLTAYAAENKIRILRREKGVESAIPFEYSRVKAGNDLKQNIILKSGDVVVVP
jgi:polysaccharide export outer membrane protein